MQFSDGVLQRQENGNSEHENEQTATSEEATQATAGNLSSPRFATIPELEEVLDGPRVLQAGDSGRGVQAVQQCLYDLGYPLPTNGASGAWDTETTTALSSFQSDNGLSQTGTVNAETIAALDSRFGSLNLTPDQLSGDWTPSGVKLILEPWSPHTIDLLKTRINLTSFDRIYWTDEQWDGSAWSPVIFEGGGYNSGGDIGIVNGTNEEVSETLYHEALHAEQPSSQTTTLEKEAYAYRIGEEFSIAAGLSGRPDLRSQDENGNEFADAEKIETFVSEAYPSVSSSAPGEQILEKRGNRGKIVVQRPDGSTYVRMAQEGETVPGPMTVVNEEVHDRSVWN
jgi:peptidoglycan hydrolase-like protein with peptidoglycan-binding domain